MTRKDLLKYRSLDKEITLLNEQLKRQFEELRWSKGADVVSGSLPEFPYVLHGVSVQGSESCPLSNEVRATIRCLKRTLKMRQRELRTLERFIARIADSELRQIFILRYMEGLSWQKIAFKTGESDESYPRRKHNRFLELAENAEFFVL